MVTDPHADSASSVALWREVLRVIKPGGHLLSFAETCNYHRVVVAIEDAGFEIRDQIGWMFGSTESAIRPAWQPLVLARRPLIGTIESNVRTFGTGGIHIDVCRIPTTESLNGGAYAKSGQERYDGYENWRFRRNGDAGAYIQPTGRWPANVIHDGSDEVMATFAQYGKRGASAPVRGHEPSTTGQNGIYSHYDRVPGTFYGDSGTAARFFFCARATEAEHNTKPLNLLRYLCRLITPLGGTVLDPFAGVSRIEQAASAEGFDAISIDSALQVG